MRKIYYEQLSLEDFINDNNTTPTDEEVFSAITEETLSDDNS